MLTKEDLKQYQALPLSIKVRMTQERVREWVNFHGLSDTYVSFSGGKDSTVLLHLIREIYPEIQAVFINTGLEYPEVQKFAKSIPNVTVLTPKMSFKEVITRYGYPFISKEISRRLQYARKAVLEGREENHGDYRKLCGLAVDKNGNKSQYNCEKYKPLLGVDFWLSAECCNVMKKTPAKKFEKETGCVPFIATMTEESKLRESSWLANGCNAFESKRPVSSPMSFWTEQDVLQYIKENGLKIAEVYGDIVTDETKTIYASDCSKCAGYKTTGCDRTGCVFCGYGAHLDKYSRFLRLKETHPKQYAYCMDGGEYNIEGFWVPSSKGLGMAHVIDTLNNIYSKDGKPFIAY